MPGTQQALPEPKWKKPYFSHFTSNETNAQVLCIWIQSPAPSESWYGDRNHEHLLLGLVISTYYWEAEAASLGFQESEPSPSYEVRAVLKTQAEPNYPKTIAVSPTITQSRSISKCLGTNNMAYICLK